MKSIRKWSLWTALIVCLFPPSSQGSEIGKPVGEVRIQPLCVIEGPIYLAAQGWTFQGRIGADVVSLNYGGPHVYGWIKGQTVDLWQEGRFLNGTIGARAVTWRLSMEGDAIFGIEPCLWEGAL